MLVGRGDKFKRHQDASLTRGTGSVPKSRGKTEGYQYDQNGADIKHAAFFHDKT
jgi:hypothetical protein